MIRMHTHGSALLSALLLIALGTLPIAVAAQQEESWEDDPWAERDAKATLHGFFEAGLGLRLRDDPDLISDWSLSEFRARLETAAQRGRFDFAFKGDLGYDDVLSEPIAELRELAISVSPTSRSDLKIGQQVLTWGTGDLVFLNDLFSKNFEAFFSGRDDEYLKNAEPAVRWLIYGDRWNWDLVWQPVFEPDQTLDGERFSFFVPSSAAIGAPRPPLRTANPSRTLENGELAARLFTSRGAAEWSIYAHRGFFQQPSAVSASGIPTYAPLAALGGSLRRPGWNGLIHLETVYYRSRDDASGTDPTVRNGQWKSLVGYEREVAKNLTAGFQYSAEWTEDHDALLAGSPAPALEPDEWRHLLTSRWTLQSARQRWRWSSFLFWSPSDRDLYWRGEVRLRANDRWSVSTAANLFWGDRDSTFFGQLKRNDNVRLLVRRTF